MSKRAKLVARFRKQCVALAKTARQIADASASRQYVSLDIHNFSGAAPVVIQTFATEPGTNFNAAIDDEQCTTDNNREAARVVAVLPAH